MSVAALVKVPSVIAPRASCSGKLTGSLRSSIPQRLSHAKRTNKSLRRPPACRAHKVEIEHDGTLTTLEVPEDETILSVALENGMDLPYDCKLGVCMTCPAKIMSGSIDQSEGMLSDDVQEAGYALMCAAYPKSDCKIRVIPEEELLSLQLVT